MPQPANFLRQPSLYGTDNPRLAWRLPALAEMQDLTAAVISHHATYKIRRAMGGRNLNQGQYASQIKVTPKVIRSILTGERPPTVDDLAAAVTVFGPSVLPEPAAVRELLRKVREALSTQQAVAQSMPDGLMLALDGYRTLTALGTPPAAIAEQPITPNEAQSQARMREAAAPLVTGAVLRISGGSSVNAIIDLARGTYLTPADAVGYAAPDSADVLVRLRDSWLPDVLDSGFAVLDDWFVLDVEDTDSRGRPLQALVLDLAPDVAFWDTASELVEPDRRFVARSARITWTTGRPVVMPAATSGNEGWGE